MAGNAHTQPPPTVAWVKGHMLNKSQMTTYGTTFSEILLQIWLDVKWSHVWRISLHRLTIFVNKELGKIPFDEISQGASLLLLEVIPQGNSISTVHVDFGEHIKLYTICSFCKGLDLSFSPWLLAAKLVTGKGENSKSFGFCKLVVQSLQLFVVFVGKPSFGRHIHNQANMAPVLF